MQYVTYYKTIEVPKLPPVLNEVWGASAYNFWISSKRYYLVMAVYEQKTKEIEIVDILDIPLVVGAFSE